MATKADKLKQQREAKHDVNRVDVRDLQDSMLTSQERFNIITRDASHHLEIEGCVATGAGLDVPSDITHEQIDNLANILFYLSGRVQLFIGDMLAVAEHLGYGFIEQKATEMGLSGQTLRNWKSTCNKVSISLRRDVLSEYPDAHPLSISHYELVQKMDDSQQREYLRMALANQWSVSELREQIRFDAGNSDKDVDHYIRWQKSGFKTLRSQLAGMTRQERNHLKELFLQIFDELD